MAKDLSSYYKDFLQKKKLLYFILDEMSYWFILERVIARFDLRMKRNHSIISGELTKDFYLFSILFSKYSSNDGIDPKGFAWLNERNLISYLRFLKKNRQVTLQKLMKFIEFMGGVPKSLCTLCQ